MKKNYLSSIEFLLLNNQCHANQAIIPSCITKPRNWGFGAAVRRSLRLVSFGRRGKADSPIRKAEREGGNERIEEMRNEGEREEKRTLNNL